MAEYADREHYIPLRKSDLINTLAGELSGPNVDDFRQFAKILSATFHYQYLSHFEEINDFYAYFDPDTVTPPTTPKLGDERTKLEVQFYEQFRFMMELANFKKIPHELIKEARKKSSSLGLSMNVDLKIFERLEIFYRGQVTGEIPVRRWYRPWRTETFKLPLIQRLAIYAKLRPDKRVPPQVNTTGVYLKLIKDIPQVDLEMMIPGAKPKMPLLQRYKLGGSVVGSGAWVGYGIVEKVASSALSYELLLGPLTALLGYGYKQYFDYVNTRKDFNLRLTQSLYYLTLSNNLGVLQLLIAEAEEQDFREALLAYFFLWHKGSAGLTAAELDDLIEVELERLVKLKVDFEIEDGLAKLEKLQLATKSGDRYHVVAMPEALRRLDEKWDNLFQYNK